MSDQRCIAGRCVVPLNDLDPPGWRRAAFDLGATRRFPFGSVASRPIELRVISPTLTATQSRVLTADLDEDGRPEVILWSASAPGGSDCAPGAGPQLGVYDGRLRCKWSLQTTMELSHVSRTSEGATLWLTEENNGVLFLGQWQVDGPLVRHQVGAYAPGTFMDVLFQWGPVVVASFGLVGRAGGVLAITLGAEDEPVSVVTQPGTGAVGGVLAVGDMDADSHLEVAFPWTTTEAGETTGLGDDRRPHAALVRLDLEGRRPSIRDLFATPIEIFYQQDRSPPKGFMTPMLARLDGERAPFLVFVESRDPNMDFGPAVVRHISEVGGQIRERSLTDLHGPAAAVVAEREGRPPRIFVSSRVASSPVCVLEGPELVPVRPFCDAAFRGRLLAAVDLDGDRSDELIAYRDEDRALVVLDRESLAEIDQLVVGPVTETWWRLEPRFALADVDGDGSIEVVLATDSEVKIIGTSSTN